MSRIRIALPPMTSPWRVSTSFGACTLALAALLALGGAAARPGGYWLGWPGAVAVAASVLAAAGVLFAPRTGEGLAACRGLVLPLALLALGVPLAGVAAVSGPPLAALVCAGLALCAAAARWRPWRAAFLPLAFAVLVAAAGRTQARVGPQGDEPHYLMVAESLLHDGDLSLERDYAEGRYRSFHDAPLAPHYRLRGRHGEVYSLHAVGLSLLVLPAWALAGYAGVVVFMALLAALLAAEVRGWARETTGRADVAEAVGWLLVLSPPLLHYAGLVFTEVPAALAVAFGLRRGARERLGPAGALGIGLAAAALPWLNVRYALLAALVVLHAAWRHRRPGTFAGLAGPMLASILGIALHHQVLYGFWNPGRVYGRRPEFALSTLAEGLPGLLFDQEFGLLVYAPVLALALPGLWLLARRDRRLGLVAAAAVASVVLMAGSWHMWRGGYNPPGRFLVPIAPILFVAVGCVWERRGLTAGAALLVGWGLWAGAGGALGPELVHRDRDGTAPFFRVASGAREWTGLLPGYVLEEADRHRLALVWAIALVAAVPWRARRPGARRVAAAGVGLALAAQAAALVSARATPDRDAVRVVGLPAVAVPGWRAAARTVAIWEPRGLDWGPLYEPHRHPGGATVGRRLPLPIGAYRLELGGERLSATGTPWLVVAPDRPGAPWRRAPFGLRDGSWSASFELRPGDGAVDLRLLGGGPILLKSLRLEAQPSDRGPV